MIHAVTVVFSATVVHSEIRILAASCTRSKLSLLFSNLTLFAINIYLFLKPNYAPKKGWDIRIQVQCLSLLTFGSHVNDIVEWPGLLGVRSFAGSVYPRKEDAMQSQLVGS